MQRPLTGWPAAVALPCHWQQLLLVLPAAATAAARLHAVAEVGQRDVTGWPTAVALPCRWQQLLLVLHAAATAVVRPAVAEVSQPTLQAAPALPLQQTAAGAVAGSWKPPAPPRPPPSPAAVAGLAAEAAASAAATAAATAAAPAHSSAPRRSPRPACARSTVRGCLAGRKLRLSMPAISSAWGGTAMAPTMGTGPSRGSATASPASPCGGLRKVALTVPSRVRSPSSNKSMQQIIGSVQPSQLLEGLLGRHATSRSSWHQSAFHSHPPPVAQHLMRWEITWHLCT